MSAEDTLKRARALVLNAETNHQKINVELYNALSGEDPAEARRLLHKIGEESDRLNPRGKWDEEEQAIINLDRKRR